MHILVAVDRSSESRNALVTALDMVDSFDCTVTALHVVPDDDQPGKETGEEVLEKVRERATRRGIEIDTQLLAGDPIEAIASYAETNNVDAIYIGHRGLSGEGREFPSESRGPLGSIAKGLVERTEIPVTVYDRGL